MVASLYPHPLAVDDVLALTGIARVRRPTHDQALRRPDPAGPLRDRARRRPRTCWCSTSRPRRIDVEGRRDFWASCGRSPPAARRSCSRRTTSRRPTPTPTGSSLMARGRIVADGPATEIKAIVGSRTIRATLPGADLDALARAAGRARRRAARRGRGAVLHRLGRRTARPCSASSRTPRHRGHGRRTRRGVPGAHRRRRRPQRTTGGQPMSSAIYLRYEAAPQLPQLAILPAVAGVSARCSTVRSPGSQRHVTFDGTAFRSTS